jgi:hypothetical protein
MKAPVPECYGAAHRVFKLSHIAGPVIYLEVIGHPDGHIEQVLSQFQTVLVQEVMDEQGDVLSFFPSKQGP